MHGVRQKQIHTVWVFLVAGRQAGKKKMSMAPNSSTFMGQSIRNGQQEPETFCKFFECWLVEQNQHLQELVSAAGDHQHHQEATAGHDNGHDVDDSDDPVLKSLIDKVVRHYEQYYRAKSSWAKHDAISMFTPSWRSTLEDAFLWLGGWRPSMAFHLLYSKSGLQLEERLEELIRGLRTGDLGDLSPSQLERVNELQQRTIREEKDVTEKMAKHQETVADTSMVELSNIVSEMIRNGETGGDDQAADRVESTLKPKEEGLEEILGRADELRLRTLKQVLDILTPIQAVYFLIAAAELHLRIHDWGKKRDADLAHRSTNNSTADQLRYRNQNHLQGC